MKQLIKVALLLSVSSPAFPSSKLDVCPLIKIDLTPYDILGMSFEHLSDSPKFKEYALKYDEMGQEPLNALTNARIDLSKNFSNPDLGDIVTNSKKHIQKGLGSFDDYELGVKAKKAKVCEVIKSPWYMGGYFNTDYVALRELVASKKDIWQERYDSCALQRIDKAKNEEVLRELVRICRRTADRQSGYKFSW